MLQGDLTRARLVNLSAPLGACANVFGRAFLERVAIIRAHSDNSATDVAVRQAARVLQPHVCEKRLYSPNWDAWFAHQCIELVNYLYYVDVEHECCLVR